MELYSLAIESAEELERLNKNLSTDLKHTEKLSELIEKDFVKRLDYSLIFSRAYYSAYHERISVLPNDNSIPSMIAVSKKLESSLNLKNEEREKLIHFCTNLSNWSLSYEEAIKNINSEGCFS
jgi:inactivated superfamily I helicase